MKLARAPWRVARRGPGAGRRGGRRNETDGLNLLKEEVNIGDEEPVGGAIAGALPLRWGLPLKMELTAVPGDDGVSRGGRVICENETKPEKAEELDGRLDVARHEDGVDCLNHDGLHTPKCASRASVRCNRR